MSFGFGLSFPRASGWTLDSAIRSLFAQGQQGFWYDSQDLSTLFQDSAGTTPCTMPGQGVAMPVGLQLDKRLGLVLGPELVTNGDFSGGTTTGYSAVNGATLSVVGGRLRVTNSGTFYSSAVVALTTTVGVNYRVALEAFRGASPSFFVTKSDSASSFTSNRVDLLANQTSDATLRCGNFIATATTTYLWMLLNTNVSGQYSEFDNISVRELPGNHRFQTGSTSRAQLSARVNQLLNTAFVGAVAGTPGTAPTSWALLFNTGALTAISNEQLTITTSASRWVIGQSQTFAANTTYDARITVVANPNGVDLSQLFAWNQGFGGTESRIVNGVSVAASYVPQPGDSIIYRLASGATGGTVTVRFGLGCSTNSTGTVTISRPDIRAANESASLPPYQRVVDPLTYDTAGFPLFIAPDGSDDFMVTNSIDFSGSDKVFVAAGVRKLSDAAQGLLLETSANAASNSGGFFVSAPNSAAANYAFLENGGGGLRYTVPTTFAAPISNVLTSTFDLGTATLADSVKSRINGVLNQVGLFQTAQTTGNFGNYPVYFYRRGGTSLPFNGRDYGMICRGGTLPTAAEIAQVERWLASKTGVVLA